MKTYLAPKFSIQRDPERCIHMKDYQLGKEAGIAELEEKDYQILRQLVGEFSAYFDYEIEEIMRHKFLKLFPRWLRPYGRLYAY
ncbi:hypothetical protein ACFLUO_08010 [Chloroflexota bacterium]